MDIQFLGATGTVTGSKYLVRHGGATLLVDCGLFQGYKQLRLRNWAPLPVRAADIDAVILTHAHLDHSGYLPLLAKQGFKGPIYCTPATYELSRLLLPDSGHLQEEQAEYAGRHGFSKHKPPLPLYTREDAEACLHLFKPVEPHRAWEPVPGRATPPIIATLSLAGHILGAASVHLRVGKQSILFSGDLGRPNDLVMEPPEAPPAADYVVVESTYGDRRHSPVDPLIKLADVINQTAAQGGVVVIPAFAVGRAQSILYGIHQLKARHAIPSIPIYLNSPMATEATDIYSRFGTEHRLTPQQCKAMFHAAHFVRSPEESRALNAKHGPMVIISASGMATGGRVLHHLVAFAPDRRNTILFTGYQAAGTRGAAMLGGAGSVRIFGEDVPLRARVEVIDNLSAHADAGEILGWLGQMPKPPRKVFITHGEPGASDGLRQCIERDLGWDTQVPDYLETVSLD